MAVIAPQTLADAAASSNWASLAGLRRVLFTVLVGPTDTTVDARLQVATSAAGAGATDMPGKAITQLGATDDNTQAQLELHAGELAGYSHVRLVVAAGDGAAGALVAGVGFAAGARFGPASTARLASVREVVR